MEDFQDVELNTEIVPEEEVPEMADSIPEISGEAAIDFTEILDALREHQETQSLILQEEQHHSDQLEGAISILLLFMVILILDYVYKFLKIFF